MTKFSRTYSSALLTIALAAGLCFGAPACATESGAPASAEPAVAEQSVARSEASGLAKPAIFEGVYYVCFNFDSGDLRGMFRTLADCSARCSDPFECVGCDGSVNACLGR